MNKFFNTFRKFVVIAFVIGAFGAQAAWARPASDQSKVNTTAATSYNAMLGKSVKDHNVADFITKNSCTGMIIFELCQHVGMALLVDHDQMVQGVFLYPGKLDGFDAYKGELPYGLAFTDTMGMVEQKFSHPIEIHAPQAGWDPGFPDEGGTPDHFHYFADYKRLGVTIIYNSPSANDKGATIQAILVDR